MFYEFEKIINVRDFDGLKTLDGRTVKSKVLLRTAALSDASDKDKERLIHEFNLKRVIDFRADNEVEKFPDPSMEGVTYYHLSVFGSPKALTKEEQEIQQKRFAMFKIDTLRAFEDMYIRMATEESAAKAYRKFFDILLDAKGDTVLWHCTQGKDRTGMAAILLLSALGCDIDTIIDEYLLTNIDSQYRLDLIYGKIEKDLYEHYEKTNLVYRFIGEAYVRTIEENYGSIMDYIHDCLGISDDKIEELKSYYLV